MTAMDDEKAVGMTTDANPLPLSAEELAAWQQLYASNPVVRRVNDMHVATIAHQAEQIAELRAELAGFHKPPMLTRW